MELSDFDYELPKELIAQKPVSPRDNSRLLVLGKKIEHKHFYDIVDYLKKGDVLVINETKVIPARLIGKKSTGSKVELIVEKIIEDNKAFCRIKTKKPRVNNELIFGKYKAKIINLEKDVFTVEFNEKLGGKIVECSFVVDLPELGGKKKLEKAGYKVFNLVEFEGE